jgi:hypothetical protein
MRSLRAWIWASIVLQGLGYVWDGVWHGVLNPGVDPTTVAEMVRHLSTVHLPLYVGAASLLAATAAALLHARERRMARRALRVAFAGAVVSVGAELWHASSHLNLDTHSGPVAGTLSFVGFLVAAGAMAAWSWRRRGRASNARRDRRAA